MADILNTVFDEHMERLEFYEKALKYAKHSISRHIIKRNIKFHICICDSIKEKLKGRE